MNSVLLIYLGFLYIFLKITFLTNGSPLNFSYLISRNFFFLRVFLSKLTAIVSHKVTPTQNKNKKQK